MRKEARAMGARFKTEGITLKKGDLIMALTSNQHVLDWVKEMEELMTPDKTIWIDGSEGQLRALREQAFATGELTELNQEELPGCVLHHTAKNDVARVEDRTFICTSNKADDCMMVNWMDPNEMKAKLLPLYKNVMAGRTMYVIPYCMGPIGSPFSKVGVEVTDSIYVVLNMDIMTRVGVKALRQLGDSNDFVRGQHARADIDPENRYIVQFPEDNAIWSINSGYGGNVLLGKKCFALRIASYQGYKEGWMAEHMLILGIEDPQGNVDYITAAFPSACGKTNLAMLIPPEVYAKQGYKVWTVGDDIAWMHIGDDGRLYAINPENGFFGVAPGTNEKSNPNALHTTMKGTIFTNVAHNLENNTVWWEGLDKNPPEDVQEWTGLAVDGKEYIANGGKLAHPNSRFTAPAANCPCLSKEFNNPNGVPVTAPRRLRWSTSPSAGRTACMSALPWLLRQLPPLPALWALSAAIRWPCVRSSATMWAITSRTGWRWARSWATRRRRSSTSTGSAPTTKATLFGRASATTCAC